MTKNSIAFLGAHKDPKDHNVKSKMILLGCMSAQCRRVFLRKFFYQYTSAKPKAAPQLAFSTVKYSRK